MLYRIQDSSWKISDFGFGLERSEQTQFSAQQESYRSPEVIISRIGSTTVKLNNKVDIWALGCIFFRVLTGKGAFYNDRRVQHYASGNAEISFASLNIRSLDDRARCILSKMCEAMLQVSEFKRPEADDVVNVLRWNTKCRRSLIWIGQCHHYPHLFIDVFAAPCFHSLWKVVTWSPDKYNIYKNAQTNLCENTPTGQLVNTTRRRWRLVMSDTGNNCLVQQWAPFNMPKKAPLLSCRRKAYQAQAHSKIRQVSSLDIELASKGRGDSEQCYASGILSLLNDESSDVLCFKINDSNYRP